MPGLCPLQPILIAAKPSAMAKIVAERETRRHHAARSEIAGPLQRQKDDVATSNFGLGRFRIVETTHLYLNLREDWIESDRAWRLL
jgi:hypothetical protein